MGPGIWRHPGSPCPRPPHPRLRESQLFCLQIRTWRLPLLVVTAWFQPPSPPAWTVLAASSLPPCPHSLSPRPARGSLPCWAPSRGFISFGKRLQGPARSWPRFPARLHSSPAAQFLEHSRLVLPQALCSCFSLVFAAPRIPASRQISLTPVYSSAVTLFPHLPLLGSPGPLGSTRHHCCSLMTVGMWVSVLSARPLPRPE